MNGPLEYEETKLLVRDYVCGQCGSRLSNPWGGYYGINGYIIRCVKDQRHEGIRRLGRRTRMLTDPKEGRKEYDIMTQRPVEDTQALALPESEEGMVARMNEAARIGLFTNDRRNPLTPAQIENLAKLALLYRLDPLMEEIIPYQGKPYITIAGRRRIDARARTLPQHQDGADGPGDLRRLRPHGRHQPGRHRGSGPVHRRQGRVHRGDHRASPGFRDQGQRIPPHGQVAAGNGDEAV